MSGYGQSRTRLPGEVPVAVELRRFGLLHGARADGRANREAKINRARKNIRGRSLAVKEPVHTVGAGIAQERVAHAAESHPRVRISRGGVVTPGNARVAKLMAG